VLPNEHTLVPLSEFDVHSLLRNYLDTLQGATRAILPVTLKRAVARPKGKPNGPTWRSVD
jgi:hypothetical protein